ncbi:30S ribosomal protein S6e [archaeon]|nr:30S ribosomal protein S6e [archaeon]|tara:strand:- start:4633 stop:5124 length:492 start_codon:yes stop_codon:yes gene_type:complete
MGNIKFVINDGKSGKTYQTEVDGSKVYGRKIKDKIKGDLLDISGYEFEITGGSDYCGFPMRPDLQISGRKKLLLTRGIGVKTVKKGQRIRKTVCGAIVNDTTHQVNMKILKYGAKKPEELFKKKEGSETEEVKEEKKEAPKKEIKPEEAKEESKEEKTEEKKE